VVTRVGKAHLQAEAREELQRDSKDVPREGDGKAEKPENTIEKRVSGQKNKPER